MPYASVSELPPAVKKLPTHQQQVFRAAFNAAFSKYGEQRAFAIAWSAAKKAVQKDSPTSTDVHTPAVKTLCPTCGHYHAPGDEHIRHVGS